jgi:hypothetical protein
MILRGEVENTLQLWRVACFGDTLDQRNVKLVAYTLARSITAGRRAGSRLDEPKDIGVRSEQRFRVPKIALFAFHNAMRKWIAVGSKGAQVLDSSQNSAGREELASGGDDRSRAERLPQPSGEIPLQTRCRCSGGRFGTRLLIEASCRSPSEPWSPACPAIRRSVPSVYTRGRAPRAASARRGGCRAAAFQRRMRAAAAPRGGGRR